MRFRFLSSYFLFISLFVIAVSKHLPAQAAPVQTASTAELVVAPDVSGMPPMDAEAGKDAGSITGTVTDVYGDVVPSATVEVEPVAGGARQRETSNDSGYFTVAGLVPNIAYRVTVSAPGFEPWIAPPVTPSPSQFFDVTGIKLKVSAAVTSVTVRSDPLEIATEQVQIEEKQRILGFVPNFYVV